MPEINVAKLFNKDFGSKGIADEKETDYVDSIADPRETDWEGEGGSVKEKPTKDETEKRIATVLKPPIPANASITISRPMALHPLYQKYDSLVGELIKLRDKKGKDYGSEEDPFANVRGASEFGVKPWIGAANSANDCLTRIKNYAKNGRLENESVRDSMLDLANYALITLVLWEEEQEADGK